jgi:hypothetical protein
MSERVNHKWKTAFFNSGPRARLSIMAALFIARRRQGEDVWFFLTSMQASFPSEIVRNEVFAKVLLCPSRQCDTCRRIFHDLILVFLIVPSDLTATLSTDSAGPIS